MDIQPDDADEWYNRGNLLHEQEKYSEAEQAYRRAIEIEPDIVHAWTNLGLVIATQGRYSEAERACRRAIEIKPNDASAWRYLGNSLMEQEFFTESVEAFENAAKYDRESWEAWYGFGLARIYLGRLREGDEAFRRAIQLNPSVSKMRDKVMMEARTETGLAMETIIKLIRGIRPEGLAAWRCVHCGVPLNREEVEMVRDEIPFECQACGSTITREFFLTGPGEDIA